MGQKTGKIWWKVKKVNGMETIELVMTLLNYCIFTITKDIVV